MHVRAGIFQAMIIFATYATVKGVNACTSSDDCSYGGVCDTGRQKCSCNLACNKFTTTRYICSKIKRFPMTECLALTLACEMQENVVITPFDEMSFKKFKTCKKINIESNEEFCRDQSYCSGNGICLKRPGTEQPYCRCVPHHSGDRCEKKLPVALPVANGDGDDSTDSEIMGSEKKQQHGIGPAPLAAIVIASCAVTALVIFYLGKRFFRTSVQNNAESTQETTNKNTRKNQSRDDVVTIQSLPESQISAAATRKAEDNAMDSIVVIEAVIGDNVACATAVAQGDVVMKTSTVHTQFPLVQDELCLHPKV